MEMFDWKLTIKFNITLMNMAGLWPPGDETYKLNFYSLYAISLITLLLVCHVISQTINLFFILDDLQAITGTVFLLLAEMLIVLKACCLIKNMRILKQLMTTLDSNLFQPKSTRQRLLVESSLNFWKRMNKTFWSMGTCTVIFWGIFPILDNTFKNYRLPFFAWYPYDTKTSPLYEITYIYQVISTSFAAYVNINTDTLIAALNMYTGTQIDLLCDNLRNLHYPDEYFNKKLIICVRHHQAILIFANDSNRFFNWIIFLQFFVSAISIGITMFQITVVKLHIILQTMFFCFNGFFQVASYSNEFYSFMIYFSAAIVEIFIYCWFGNEVEIKSRKISYALFESDWTTMSPKTKTTMMFFLLRCHKPLKISAFNLFYLSLDTFVG
ncbi:7tm 6 domain containing protein, partial [Asbolus verrucosus]